MAEKPKKPGSDKTAKRTVQKAKAMAREVSEHEILKGIIGRTVGNCTIQSMLGRGGMGAVYKAMHKGIKREVAIKILPKSFHPDPDRIRRFFREAESLGQVRHRNIVEIYNVGEEEGLYFIEMEYVAGQDLEDIIRQGDGIDAQRAHETMVEVCRGLREAHARQIVHRDIKPANILITGEGEVKLADFGVAKSLSKEENLTIEGSVIGTPQYMSPEQCRGESLDHRSDIYSLGAVFYYCLCGRRPFESDNPMSILMKHMREDVQPPSRWNPDLDPSYNSIVERMLAKDPRERYQTIDEVLEHLEDIKLGRTVEYTSRRVRRRRFLAVLLALLLLGAGAGTVLLIQAWPHKPPPAPVFTPKGRLASLLAEGERLLGLGKTVDAETALTQALKEDPDHPEVQRLLREVGGLTEARELKKAGKFAGALTRLGEAFGADFEARPRDTGTAVPPPAKKLAAQCRHRIRYAAELASGSFLKARETLAGLISLEPTDPMLTEDRNVLTEVAGAVKKARENHPLPAFETLLALAKGPRWGPLLEKLGESLLGQCLAQARRSLDDGDFDPATRMVSRILHLVPDHEEASALEAEIRERRSNWGTFDELIAQGDQALAGDPAKALEIFQRARKIRRTDELDERIDRAIVESALVEVRALEAKEEYVKALSALDTAREAARRRPQHGVRVEKARKALLKIYRTKLLREIRAALEARDLKAGKEAVTRASRTFPGDQAIEAFGQELGRIERIPEGMVYIPKGFYPVGGTDEKSNPRRTVELKPFYISIQEISNREFKAFVDAGGYEREELWHPEGWKLVHLFKGMEGKGCPGNWVNREIPPRQEDLPVACVSWFEADAYARYEKKRLPSEVEWEVAAAYDPASGNSRRYPWGDFWSSGSGILASRSAKAGLGPVNRSAGDRSKFGCLNMAGNVAEWTKSLWTEGGAYYVIRGSHAFYVNPRKAAVTYRRNQRSDPARFRVKHLGFRLAQDAP